MNSQLLILISGHNASGKSTLAEKIEQQIDINRVSGDAFREMLMSNIRYYSDTHCSYPNERIASVNRVVSIARIALIKELFSQCQSVLLDGAGITRKERADHLDVIKFASGSVKTIMIEVIVDEGELLDRLETRDKKNTQHKWVDFYKDIRKERYESVEVSEADLVLRYDQNNAEEIIKEIVSI